MAAAVFAESIREQREEQQKTWSEEDKEKAEIIGVLAAVTGALGILLAIIRAVVYVKMRMGNYPKLWRERMFKARCLSLVVVVIDFIFGIVEAALGAGVGGMIGAVVSGSLC